jgi:hypothetical protein
MHSVTVAGERHVKQRVGSEIALLRLGGPDLNSQLGGSDMGRGPVGSGINRYGFKTRLAAGVDYPERDFTSVGHQNAPQYAVSLYYVAGRRQLPPSEQSQFRKQAIPVCKTIDFIFRDDHNSTWSGPCQDNLD